MITGIHTGAHVGESLRINAVLILPELQGGMKVKTTRI
jgi:hypothetical protein